MPRGMNKEDLEKALTYGALTVEFKDRAFVRKELEEKLCTVHLSIFTLVDFMHLFILCIAPLVVTPHTGRTPRLIDDFLGVT